MFERFTASARYVVSKAQDEAHELKHPYLGTEHLLLALLDPGSGLAHEILTTGGLQHDQVRDEIERRNHDRAHVFSPDDAEALATIGIDLAVIRTRMEQAFGAGALDLPVSPPTRQRRLRLRRRPMSLRLTSAAKRTLHFALREAVRLGDRVIGSEHILLGLVREHTSPAASVLADGGFSLDVLRRQVLH